MKFHKLPLLALTLFLVACGGIPGGWIPTTTQLQTRPVSQEDCARIMAASWSGIWTLKARISNGYYTFTATLAKNGDVYSMQAVKQDDATFVASMPDGSLQTSPSCKVSGTVYMPNGMNTTVWTNTGWFAPAADGASLTGLYGRGDYSDPFILLAPAKQP